MSRLGARMLVVLMAALAALLGGCGVPSNDSPQAIPVDDLPPNLIDPNPGSSTTLPESPGTTPVAVYFLQRVGDSDRLVEVERQVKDPSLPGERITSLLSDRTETEIEEGLTTAIPAGTLLLDATRGTEADELVVNLSSQLFDIEGEALAKAFAQIVWTVTGPDGGGYTRVRFLVDGQARNALDAEGVEQEGPVHRSDYNALAPPRG